MEDIKVSVITPCRNSAKTLARCLASVQFQTHQNWEILAVDDGSSDQTEDILLSYAAQDPRIHTFRNKGRNGAGTARNLALLRSSGDYIAFLDSDDSWIFCKLKLQLAEMLQSSQHFSFTAYKAKGPLRSTLRGDSTIEKEAQILRKCRVGCSTVMHIRQEPPLLMSRIKRRQDLCHWVRFIRSGHRLHYIKTPLSLYHIGLGSLSGSKLKSAVYQWIAYRKYLQISRLHSMGYMLSYIALNLHQRLVERRGRPRTGGDF